MPAVAEPPEPRALPLTAATKASPGIRSSRLATSGDHGSVAGPAGHRADLAEARPGMALVDLGRGAVRLAAMHGEARRRARRRRRRAAHPPRPPRWPAGTSHRGGGERRATRAPARAHGGAGRGRRGPRRAVAARWSVSAAVAAARHRLGARAMASTGPARPRATSAPLEPECAFEGGSGGRADEDGADREGVHDAEHTGQVGPGNGSLHDRDGDDLGHDAGTAEEQHEPDGDRRSADHRERRVGRSGDDDGDRAAGAAGEARPPCAGSPTTAASAPVPEGGVEQAVAAVAEAELAVRDEQEEHLRRAVDEVRAEQHEDDGDRRARVSAAPGRRRRSTPRDVPSGRPRGRRR